MKLGSTVQQDMEKLIEFIIKGLKKMKDKAHDKKEEMEE